MRIIKQHIIVKNSLGMSKKIDFRSVDYGQFLAFRHRVLAALTAGNISDGFLQNPINNNYNNKDDGPNVSQSLLGILTSIKEGNKAESAQAFAVFCDASSSFDSKRFAKDKKAVNRMIYDSFSGTEKAPNLTTTEAAGSLHQQAYAFVSRKDLYDGFTSNPQRFKGTSTFTPKKDGYPQTIKAATNNGFQVPSNSSVPGADLDVFYKPFHTITRPHSSYQDTSSTMALKRFKKPDR